MKKSLIVIICILTLACDRPLIVFEEKSPYYSEWIVFNRTGRNIRFNLNITYANDKQEIYVDRGSVDLEQDDYYYQDFSSNNKEVSKFSGLFYNSDELISCCAYITSPDGATILKEWVMGADNGEHDLFDESQWEHRSWERPQSYYTIYHNAWTFTLTEADIAVAE